MNNNERNLRPTKEAKVAMIMWGEEYAAQYGGSMDFWDSLSELRKQKCRRVVEEVIAATSFDPTGGKRD